MTWGARRRTLGRGAAALVAGGLLLVGCGSSGSSPESEPTGKPVATLKARQVKAALPDKASLSGWRQVGSRLVDTDTYMCQIVAKEACGGVVATGSANFTRGAQRTKKWIRFSFSVYSCRTEKDAERLYKKLPSYDRRTVRASLGDESVASGQLLDGTHPTAVMHDKVRVGRTVLWTSAMGSPKAVTSERAEMAATLQTDRVEQARKGLKPTAAADVP